MNRLQELQRLRRLPKDERALILQAMAEKAAEWYKNDKELTTFETFGENDFYKYDEITS